MSAMNEVPKNVTGHLISPKDPVKSIPGQFVNKTIKFFTSEKLIDKIIIFFSFYTNINGCV